jgi:hypothetical protein
MRAINISGLIGLVRDYAARDALKEVELASAEFNLVDIASPFTITGAYTETRELEPGVSTLAETQAFIATFIDDLKRGGQSRST